MLIKLAWRNLWRNKLRTSIIVGAMMFGLVGVIAMMGFMTGFVDSMVKNAIRWQTSHIQIQTEPFLRNPEIGELIPNGEVLTDKLKQLEGVESVSSRFIADGMIASARSNRGVRINGIDSKDESQITPLTQHITHGEWIDDNGRNPILVSERMAQRLTLRVGSKVVLTFTDVDGQVAGAAYRVKGIFKTPSSVLDDGNVFVRKEDLQKTANMSGVHEVALLLNDPNTLEQQQRRIDSLASEYGQQLKVRNWRQIQPILSTMMKSMDVSNQVILVIFVVAMMFGIINIMLMSVFERTQEFGVLMAVGMQKHKVFSLIILETSMLGMTGAVFGISCSALLINILNSTGISLASMSDGLGAYGIDTLLYPRVSLFEYQMIFLTVLVASVLAAVYPARQILKRRPVDAMAERN
ncbi:MAG TPA: ABC transporter permease [Vibrio sp.]|nr:ABC transporter permease [Vibrio sp.]